MQSRPQSPAVAELTQEELLAQLTPEQQRFAVRIKKLDDDGERLRDFLFTHQRDSQAHIATFKSIYDRFQQPGIPQLVGLLRNLSLLSQSRPSLTGVFSQIARTPSIATHIPDLNQETIDKKVACTEALVKLWEKFKGWLKEESEFTEKLAENKINIDQAAFDQLKKLEIAFMEMHFEFITLEQTARQLHIMEGSDVYGEITAGAGPAAVAAIVVNPAELETSTSPSARRR